MTRRRSLIPVVVLVLGAGSARSARAQPAGCPPDAWFCDEGTEEDPAAEPQTPTAPATGDADDDDDGSEERAQPARRWSSDAPTSGRRDIDVRPAARAADARDEQDADELARLSPWSVNLRVQGVLLGESRRRGDGGMGGAGGSLRYRVNPVLTLDLGLDSLIGTDYNGYERGELSVSFSTLLYFSRHPAVRTYGIFGLNSSSALVDVAGQDEAWSYFGAHAGLGLDIPLDRRVALAFDLIGFIRGRTDSAAAERPEFTDGLGRVSNTGGGGLFRAGVNLFW